MASSANAPHGHHPVMEAEVRALLEPVLGPGKRALDCTLGRGGHTALLLATGAEVIALDRDRDAIEAARARFGDEPRLTLVHAPFSEAGAILAGRGGRVDALFADLGVSSPQLDVAARGFSFQENGPLDMRMDQTRSASLAERLAAVDTDTLAGVLWRYGDEKASRKIARAILAALEEGELTGTRRLAELVAGLVPPGRSGGKRGRRIHPATRTFQALRIWVNDELAELEALLASLPSVLRTGGRAAFLSFHSLEDRPVKQALRELARGCTCPPDFPVCACGKVARGRLLTRKGLEPDADEIARNPRARSAHLRALEWLEVSDV
ncbi:MAG: 16S rRNA (cytosine(1402)-N(4))-methyltransferase RsmH [Deltaproteobacteria bacterium]|nr:16S rRNA (cytosine(1402)-N(4))-methyltransferase RsmH [Deltaproteobacteria bacterium]